VSVSLFSIVGDAIWIVAMAMIASGSQRFWRRLPADARVPMQWSVKRPPTWRAAKPLAFGLTIGIPFVLGLVLSAAARAPSNAPSDVLLIFLTRTFTGPLFVLIHYAWMGAAARTLNAEGALKP
jgi:hypothetical protein